MNRATPRPPIRRLSALALAGVAAILAAFLAAFLAGPVVAQTISFEPVECLPAENNLAVRATVGTEGGTTVRLNFRRLHPAGAYYWLEMVPEGDEVYRAVVPRPERRAPSEVTDEWWEVLATRDWIVIPERDRDWLEEYLDDRELEPAELYVTVVDASGRQLARSEVRLVDVREPEDCPTELDPVERGQAANQTVGERSEHQAHRPLFHWLCYGIVTRISVGGITRGDEHCRPCVIAAAPALDTPAAP